MTDTGAAAVAQPRVAGETLTRSLVWRLPIWLVALQVLLPVLVILLSWTSSEVDVWQHLIETQLGLLLSNTLLLVSGVLVGVVVLGVGLAWLTAMCEFPGRRWFDWALMLPLAVPAYVLAFVFLGLLDYAGPVQTFWRSCFGSDAWFPNVRGTGGVILVLVAVFYPYVYMLSRAAFLSQGRGTMDAARTLGYGAWGAFFRVALPMARPAIVAGAALAMMETLADFGAVSVFNFDTFTTAIYKSWFGFFNLNAAAQLASLLLLFVGLGLFLERRTRGRGRVEQHERQHHQRYPLRGALRWLAFLMCLLVLALCFLIPIGQLLYWIVDSWDVSSVGNSFFKLIYHTIILGAVAAFAVVCLALLVAVSQRLYPSRANAAAVGLAGMGYALPGSVLAVGIMLAFAFLDSRVLGPLQEWLGIPAGQLLVGSLLALISAYIVRFFAVGFGPVQAGMETVRPALQDAALSLGASRKRLLLGVYLPMLLPGVLTAAVMVLVDVMKEMPATLLLRPFGWDTLAVRVFELTSEGEWQRAALPSVALVLVGLIPVVMMMRSSNRH